MTFNKTLRAIVLTGIFLIPFLALVVSGTFLFPSTFFPFITGKNFAFRIIIELVLGAWLILALRDRTYAPKKSWIMWAIAIFLAIMAVADALSENPYKSFWSNFERMEGYVTLLHLAAYFVVASTMLNGRKLWNWFWHAWIGSSLFMVFYSILQLRGEIAIDQGSTRVDATLGNADYLAVFLLINVFILLYYILSRRSRLKHVLGSCIAGFSAFILFYITHLVQLSQEGSKVGAQAPGVTLFIISAVGIIACLYGLFANFESEAGENIIKYSLYVILIVLDTWVMIETATRGAVLGLACGLFFVTGVLAFAARRFYGVSEKDNILVIYISRALFCAFILVVVIFFSIKNTSFVQKDAALQRLSTMATLNLVQFAQNEGGARFQIWKMALDGAKERPILGWGQESFNYLFYKYYSPAMYNQEPWFDRAHNVFLDWLVAGGTLGLLSYLSLFAAVIYYIWWGKRKDPALGSPDSPESLDLVEKSVLTGLLIAYFVHNIFVFDNLVSYLLFFSIIAYVHTLYGEPIAIFAAKVSDEKANAKASDDDKTNSLVVSAVIAVCTLIVIYLVNVPGLEGSILLVNALGQQPNGVEQNLQIYQQIFNLNMFGKYEAREQLVQLAIQVAGATDLSANDKTAVFNMAYAQMVEQLKETPNDLRYYYFMGSLLDAYSQFSQALPYWQKAVELSPNRQLMIISLATVQQQLGDTADANANFKKAYELEPDYTDAAVLYFSSSGQYQQLVGALQEEIVNDPTNADDYLSLAQAYDELGDKTDAIAALQHVATDDPQYATQVQGFISEVKAGKQLQ